MLTSDISQEQHEKLCYGCISKGKQVDLKRIADLESIGYIERNGRIG